MSFKPRQHGLSSWCTPKRHMDVRRHARRKSAPGVIATTRFRKQVGANQNEPRSARWQSAVNVKRAGGTTEYGIRVRRQRGTRKSRRGPNSARRSSSIWKLAGSNAASAACLKLDGRRKVRYYARAFRIAHERPATKSSPPPARHVKYFRNC